MTQYADVKTYWGCYEIAHLLRPYLWPMATGLGFGLVVLLNRLVLWLASLRSKPAK